MRLERHINMQKISHNIKFIKKLNEFYNIVECKNCKTQFASLNMYGEHFFDKYFNYIPTTESIEERTVEKAGLLFNNLKIEANDYLVIYNNTIGFFKYNCDEFKIKEIIE